MTSTPVSNLSQAQHRSQIVSKSGKLWIGIIGVLFIAFHWHFIYKTFRIGISDADWSHVVIIPLISLYYVHLNRKQIFAATSRTCWWGLPFIIAGIAGYVLGIYPIRNDMAMGYSMIMTLFGIVLLLLGPGMMRHLWFPIVFLAFFIKVSDAIWSVVASKMQNIAAYGAVVLLDLTSGLTDMNADLRGNTIDLDYFANGEHVIKPMNVAEACAGMRMLMAFLALGVALAFLFPRQWWQRLIMVLMAAPIAIFVNAARVAVLGWLHLIDPSLAEGDFHIFVGMLMLLPAAGLLMLVGWCLDKVIIIEVGKQSAAFKTPYSMGSDQFSIDKPRLIKGLLVGAGVMIMVGLSYILLINRMSGGEVLQWLGAGANTASLTLCVVLFLVGLGYSWWSTRSGDRKGQLAMCQGIVAGLLVAATLGQNGAINAMGVALNKKPLPLRYGIALSFPEKAGDWVLLHQDPRLPSDIEKELGTSEYFNRYYLNTATGLRKSDITVTKKETKLGEMLSGWSGIDDPGALAKVHVTYYTGMLDAVPHVPDRCWLAAGMRPLGREVYPLELSREDYRADPDHPGIILADSTGFEGKTVRLPSDKIDAIVFSGGDDDGNTMSAMYFFLANGDAVASSQRVRFSFNLEDRYSYYCKVEVMFPGVNDPDKVAELSEDLLSDLLPEIMACLPDWTEVEQGTYPETK